MIYFVLSQLNRDMIQWHLFPNFTYNMLKLNNYPIWITINYLLRPSNRANAGIIIENKIGDRRLTIILPIAVVLRLNHNPLA